MLYSAAPGGGMHSELLVPGDGGAAAVDSNVRFVMLTQLDKLADFSSALLPLLHSLWKNLLPENTKLKGGLYIFFASSHFCNFFMF